MWHFDADALADYSGEKDFWKRAIAEKIFFTIYSKEWKNGKCGTRRDCKEEPDKTVKQSLEHKLNACSWLGAWAIWGLFDITPEQCEVSDGNNNNGSFRSAADAEVLL
jgi:hypothetical protein